MLPFIFYTGDTMHVALSHVDRLAFALLCSVAWLIAYCLPVRAEISVEILRPTVEERIVLSRIITYQGVISIPEHPEKEEEAVIVWQMKVGDSYILATTRSGEERTYTLDVPFPDSNVSFGLVDVFALVEEFQVVGTGSFMGDGALQVIVLEETGENYEGWIVNNTDSSEQDMVIGQPTDELEGCVYFIEGYCIHPHKDIPSEDRIFLQPWTSDSPSRWAYWIRQAIEYATDNDCWEGDKLDAVWYIADRAGSYNEILSAIGYPPDGPTRDWETDVTAPSTPIVTDDGDTTSSTVELYATWVSDDPESEIVQYIYAIGSTVGGTEVIDWTSAGTAAEVTESGLSLEIGETYYFAVKAMNEAGLWSSPGHSDGIQVIVRQEEVAVYNYPNPFNPDQEMTNIRFNVDEVSEVEIKIFDIAGESVWSTKLAASPGENVVSWDGRNEEGNMVANGVYLLRINMDGEVVLGRIAVLR